MTVYLYQSNQTSKDEIQSDSLLFRRFHGFVFQFYENENRKNVMLLVKSVWLTVISHNAEKRTLSAMLCGSVAWPLLALTLCFGWPEPPLAGAEAPKLCPFKFQAQTKSELVHNIIKSVLFNFIINNKKKKKEPVEEVENAEFGWRVGRRLGESRRRRCREVEQKKGQRSACLLYTSPSPRD